MIVTATDAATNPRAGGKASVLGRLTRSGHRVPPFVVVVGGETHTQAELVSAAADLGQGPYAVRSSALQEDGTEHSHAGQYESILDVPAAGLAAAVAQVVASGDADGLAGYRTRRGLDGSPSYPAAIIQAMVAAEKAGVAFSADPVTGARGTVVVSATMGLGDKLVSGDTDGSSWWLSRGSHAVLRHSGDAILNAGELAEIAALAERVEAEAGLPQDIEWAVAGGELYLLQARQITSPLRSVPLPDQEMLVLDNSNIVESYPGLVSPLTYSFASYAYARVYVGFLGLLGVPADTLSRNRPVFDNMLARADGRVFYNLGNWYRALAMLPGYRLNAAHMETMMGVGEPLPEPLASAVAGGPPLRGLRRMQEFWRLARAGAGLCVEAARLGRTSRNFRQRLERALEVTAPDKVAAMPLSALATAYRTVEADLLDRWDAPIVNDFLCMIAFGASRKMLGKWFGQEGLEIHNDVLIGQGDIVSAQPAQLIRVMGELARNDAATLAALAAGDVGALRQGPIGPALDDYVVRFGDRCTEELKLESLTLDQDPRPLHAAVLAAATAAPRQAGVRDDPFARLRAAAAGHPLRGWIARRMLGLAKRRVRDRENLRYERTRIFGSARRLFAAIGTQFHALGYLDDPRHVFSLTVPEVLGAIEGSAVSMDLKSVASARRAEAAAQAKLPEPPERLVIRGAAILAQDAAAAHAGLAPDTSSDNGAERHGTACSAGRVTAVARVVMDPRTQQVGAGEILVARSTDPGWIALFANAGAIVAERGSLLSHSAIVSRELGIPCVVAVRGACGWIHDGETITVDGGTGQVIRHVAGAAH